MLFDASVVRSRHAVHAIEGAAQKLKSRGESRRALAKSFALIDGSFHSARRTIRCHKSGTRGRPSFSRLRRMRGNALRTWLMCALAVAANTLNVATPGSMTPVARSASLRINDEVRRRFGSSGVVVLRQCMEASRPLIKIGCPRLHEMIGVHQERSLAGALACSLLRTDAVRDPKGDFGVGWTHAHDHYSYSHLFEQQKRTVVVVLAREPMTLTLQGYPQAIVAPTAFSSTSHTAVFEVDDLQTSYEAKTPPPEPEIDLDPGDAIIIRGDITEPPGGLGGGALVYAFTACEPSHSLALQLSPTLEARAQLARILEDGGDDENA